MKELLQFGNVQKLPVFSQVTAYIGKSFDVIISEHPEYKEIAFQSDDSTRLLEIRLQDATLSCILKNNVCIEAYQFSD